MKCSQFSLRTPVSARISSILTHPLANTRSPVTHPEDTSSDRILLRSCSQTVPLVHLSVIFSNVLMDNVSASNRGMLSINRIKSDDRISTRRISDKCLTFLQRHPQCEGRAGILIIRWLKVSSSYVRVFPVPSLYVANVLTLLHWIRSSLFLLSGGSVVKIKSKSCSSMVSFSKANGTEYKLKYRPESETVTGQFFLSCPALSSCAEAQLALLVLSCSARPKFWWDCPALQDRTGRPAGRTLFLSYIRFVVKYHTNMSPLLPFKQVRFYSFHMRISLPTAL